MLVPETLRVLELFCGQHDVRKHLYERNPNQSVHYTGIDANPLLHLLIEDRDLAPGNRIHVARIHPVTLSIHDHQALRKQLDDLLGRDRFHEIYSVMPPSTLPMYAANTGALRILARHLEPGGRLTYVIDVNWNFLGESLQNHIGLPLGGDDTVQRYMENRKHLEELAAQAGLTVHAYAFKPLDANWQSKYPWHSNDEFFEGEPIERWIHRLSANARYAHHAVVFEKPELTSGSTS